MTEQDKELQAQVQKILNEMEAEERELLQRRTLASQVSVRNTIIVFVVGYTFSFGLLVGVYCLLQQRIRDRKQAEQALKQSDRKFRAIFNQSFQFIGLLTPQGILLEVNQTALDFAGVQAEDVIGRPFWEEPWWSTSEAQDQLKAGIPQAAAGDFVRYEVDIRGADGRIATVDFSLKDEKLLRQILSNLLSNAIKYSPDGGNVQVRLTCEDNKVMFQVQDEGIGIPTEHQQNLFKSFSRASNVGTIAGTGLGLSIVKKCVELHGGQIAVRSQVGIGTTFTVTLLRKRDWESMK